ncbi:hypothetical protein GQ600_17207 [Phytophthora cactorum]|nr:hypothetical protein GQ600_17207 [Phytophthora cactorum]
MDSNAARSILTSSDGLFGDNVEENRVTEAPAPRPQDTPGYKPLYEQLQERKEKKDSEWKEKNNPFAPPKGLDEEELDYIQDLESKKEDIERKRQAQHEEDLAQFLSKKKTAVVVVKAKRKAGKDKADSKRAGSADKVNQEPLKKKPKVDKSPETKKHSNTAALGLAAYGSGSDSDSETDAS